jgi:hypothetical protein
MCRWQGESLSSAGFCVDQTHGGRVFVDVMDALKVKVLARKRNEM